MGEELQPARSSEEIQRAKYLSETAFALMPEMRVLFRGGRLTSQAGWRNVAEHCFASAIAADIFAEALGLSGEEGRALVSTSAVSDWNKRLEKRPEQFSEDEKKFAEDLIARVNPNKKLLLATGPDFFVRTYEDPQGVTFLENLMDYIDDITDESRWVSFRERVPKVLARWKNLDETYSARLGGKTFVEYVIEYDAKFQEELYARLKVSLEAQGKEGPSSPDDIPAWLNRMLDERVRSAASKDF